MASASCARTPARGMCLLAAVLAIAPVAGAQGEADVGGDAASWLERRVALAESGQFYLMLDPVASALTLALGGVALLEVPASSVTVFTPRVFFRRAEVPAGWQDATWLHGTLDPPLPVAAVVPPPTGDTEIAAVPPPLPDDVIPAPDVYDIRFEGGLALRVVASDAGTPRGVGLAAAARERWRMLWSEASDVVRIELVVEAEDAGRLYRALPPDTALIVAPLPPAAPEI